MGTRRRFSQEFKFEAVKLVRDRGVSVVQAARDLDVHENVLRKWVRTMGSAVLTGSADSGAARPDQSELVSLRKENAKLRMERDILKKAAAYFAKESM